MKKKISTDKKYNNQKSLKELVYHYLCDEMKTGGLSADHFINQAEICKKLDISKAPLRDALIQLETEGFVSILPRRGVLINSLTLEDIAEAYTVLAALESEAIKTAFDVVEPKHIKQMVSLNEQMHQTLQSGEFVEYYDLNIDFHNIFIDLLGNKLLKKIVTPIKKRLYDFPLRNYNIEWEEVNILEHVRIIDSIKKGNKEAAANIIRYEHWSFDFHRNYIIEFYDL